MGAIVYEKEDFWRLRTIGLQVMLTQVSKYLDCGDCGQQLVKSVLGGCGHKFKERWLTGNVNKSV